jgi:hypothetical protein
VRAYEGHEEVLESMVVAMDPVVDGFAGVLVELVFDGERYVLTETALGSGNRLLRSRWRDPRAAYALLEAELAGGTAARRHDARET